MLYDVLVPQTIDIIQGKQLHQNLQIAREAERLETLKHFQETNPCKFGVKQFSNIVAITSEEI